MDHMVRERLNEIRRKQLESQENSQNANTPASRSDKSQSLVALGGVAAGLIIAIIVWLASSIWTNDTVSIHYADSDGAIQASVIREANTQIGQLSGRIEALTESINSLESRLTRVLELSESINEIEAKYAAAMLDNSPTSAGNLVTDNAAPSDTTDSANDIEISFVPTHTVDTRVNLRPSMSLDTTPIAVLEAGTGVEYIKETDGWLYVNTEHHGKGWCYSRYLSPLPLPSALPPQANQDD